MFPTFSLGEAIGVVLVGALTAMYSVELVKTFSLTRGRLHEHWIKRYLSARARLLVGSEYVPNELVAYEMGETDSAIAVPRIAWSQLVNALGRTIPTRIDEIRIGRREPVFRLLDLPLERLMAQISSATQFNLEAPRFNERTNFTAFLLSGEFPGTKESEEGRFRFLIDRGVDELGTYVADRWRRLVRLVALILAIGFTTLGGVAVDADSVGLYIPLGLLIAGPTAWVMRDIMAALEGLRSR